CEKEEFSIVRLGGETHLDVAEGGRSFPGRDEQFSKVAADLGLRGVLFQRLFQKSDDSAVAHSGGRILPIFIDFRFKIPMCPHLCQPAVIREKEKTGKNT